MKNILHAFDLKGATDDLEPFYPKFTYWQDSAHTSQLRRVSQWQYSIYTANPTHSSDHALVPISFKRLKHRSESNAGIISWKMNNKVIENKIFREHIRKEATAVVESEEVGAPANKNISKRM